MTKSIFLSELFISSYMYNMTMYKVVLILDQDLTIISMTIQNEKGSRDGFLWHCFFSLRASSLGGGGREGERGESSLLFPPPAPPPPRELARRLLFFVFFLLFQIVYSFESLSENPRV